MKNINSFWLKIFAFSLLVLALPTLGSAQYTNRDCDDDNYNRGGNNRGGYGNNGGYSNSGYGNNGYYDTRSLQDAIRRIKDQTGRFQNDLDTALDNSRSNGSDWEDGLNASAKDFKKAIKNLDKNFKNGRDLNRSSNDAYDAIRYAQEIDRDIYRAGVNYDVQNQWSQIQSDLRFVADGYNISYSPRSRNNRGNARNNRGNNNGNGGWRNRIPSNIPFPF